ncbi:MAG: hypothetical protein WC747_03640 [Candidatus Babeliales bacterium]
MFKKSLLIVCLLFNLESSAMSHSYDAQKVMDSIPVVLTPRSHDRVKHWIIETMPLIFNDLNHLSTIDATQTGRVKMEEVFIEISDPEHVTQIISECQKEEPCDEQDDICFCDHAYEVGEIASISAITSQYHATLTWTNKNEESKEVQMIIPDEIAFNVNTEA